MCGCLRGSRLQHIKHVEIIYIEPIYLSVGVIKISLSRAQVVCFKSVFGLFVCFTRFSSCVCVFSLKFMIADWLGWFRRRVFFFLHVSEKMI